MPGLFTQSYDIIPGKEMRLHRISSQSTLLPGMAALGLAPVGAYYVEVGSGPKIL